MWTWFISTRLGRFVLKVAFFVGGVALLLWQAFNRGKDAARKEQREATLDAVHERKQLDADIDRLDDDDIRQRMQDHWSR